MILFTRRKLYYIVADYYSNSLYFQKLTNFLFSISSGCIVLNNNIKSKLSAKVEVLAGIVETKDISTKPFNNKNNNNILFSGSLGKTTGFELALKMGKELNDYNLFISGKPYEYTDIEFQKLLDSHKSDNIYYLGLLNHTEYLELIKKCNIALSLRDPKDIQHDYNFPSKILEYMSNGMIVISTKNYDELDENLYFRTKGFFVKELIEAVLSISKIENITDYKIKIANYIQENFTADNLLNMVIKLENK